MTTAALSTDMQAAELADSRATDPATDASTGRRTTSTRCSARLRPREATERLE